MSEAAKAVQRLRASTTRRWWITITLPSEDTEWRASLDASDEGESINWHDFGSTPEQALINAVDGLLKRLPDDSA